ncbi:hypothetical protein OR259_21750 [Vibrio parahaemolyticus]|uniref:hypothetical protein n=1 Tax=Vibrio parahaemolyticus TaxID=670 RepID=UPI002AC56B66|nr:hypothetical protein [Vibrio parahaemolyticus]MDZ5120818.1 hypothetical protein [Vibrio parahaemolyticus]
MSNVISVSSLPYNLPSNEQEQLRILAKIIDFKPELLVGAGKVEVDAICSMILYRHLSQKQRVDAMKLIRSVSNRALMGKLVTGALDTTFVNPQYGMWSMTEKELQSDKDFHSFLDNLASYIGIGASSLGLKDLYKESKARGKLGRGGLAVLVIWGAVAFNKSELKKVNAELENRSVRLVSGLHQ